MSYEEIAKRGGGILNSAKKLSQTNEDELYEQAAIRLKELIKWHRCYRNKKWLWFNTLSELKMLRVIAVKKHIPDYY